MPEAITVAGVEFQPVTRDQAVERVIDLAEQDSPALVVTPNVDHVVMLQHDATFRAAYDAARLRLCDGYPLVALSRLCGHRVPERVTGADLFGDVCREAAERDLEVFVVGGAPAVLRDGVAAIRRSYPSLRISGHSPPLHFENTPDDAVVQERIANAAPDIVAVCLGAPRSEIWSQAQMARHSATYLCVGAAIDFAAGARRRAPQWLQRIGMEWSYRLIQEPRRLSRRYLVRDVAFVPIAARQLWRTHAPWRRRSRTVPPVTGGPAVGGAADDPVQRVDSNTQSSV